MSVARNVDYQPLSQVNMDDFFRDENKFEQLPWEDPMLVFNFSSVFVETLEFFIVQWIMLLYLFSGACA